jgi:hypothetical protein
MEQLSCNITFRLREEILQEEINELIFSFSDRYLEIPQVNLAKAYIFAPTMAYLGSVMKLEYPKEDSSESIDQLVSSISSQIKSMGVVQLIELHSKSLPDRQWKENFNSIGYSDALKRRRIKSGGSKKKAKYSETQTLLERDIMLRLFRQIRLLTTAKQLETYQNIETFLMNSGKCARENLLARIPSADREINVLTIAGLDHNRVLNPNDFMDVDNMIIPPIYADAFVARDRWVKNIMSDVSVSASCKAKFLTSLPELIAYCETLLQ